MPFPLPEETTTEVEEVKHPQTTRAATKANQPNNKAANKLKEGLKEVAEEEDNHQEVVKVELMELKPPKPRTADQNVCSVE